MADKRNKDIPPDPHVMEGIARLGYIGYLEDQFEAWRGDWIEWECGENDEELCGAWEDGDEEQAAFFAALLVGAQALDATAQIVEIIRRGYEIKCSAVRGVPQLYKGGQAIPYCFSGAAATLTDALLKCRELDGE